MNQKRKRRVALQSLVVASAAVPFMPKQWAKPVVSALVLPVHAQTSESTRTPEPTTYYGVSSFAAVTIHICISDLGQNMYSVIVASSNSNTNSTVVTTSPPTQLGTQVMTTTDCLPPASGLLLTVTSFSSTEAFFDIGSVPNIIPLGACSIPDQVCPNS